MPTLRITIDGRECRLPTLDSLNMDEGEILWDYAQVTVGDLMMDDNLSLRPSVLKAFLHVALIRADPTLTLEAIKKEIGQVSYGELFAALSGDEEGDADPQMPATAPDPEQLSKSIGESGSSTSESQDSEPSPTGAPASLRSVTSDQQTLAS